MLWKRLIGKNNIAMPLQFSFYNISLNGKIVACFCQENGFTFEDILDFGFLFALL